MAVRHRDARGSGRERRARNGCARWCRFQQLSAPTAAKSVEDTAFYRYGRLLSRNEVGSEPSQFAITPEAFHSANKRRQRRLPLALLATATHDHKRGEDTRVRLAVLCEIPGEWEAALHAGCASTPRCKRDLDGIPPRTRRDEMMLYQTLVAAWPLDLAPDDARRRESVRGAGRRLAGEVAARGQAPFGMGGAECRSTKRLAGHSSTACLDPGRAPVCRRDRRLRRPDRARRRPQRARPDRAAPGQPRASPTSIKAPSSGISPWSTPTIAARSTSPRGSARSRRRIPAELLRALAGRAGEAGHHRPGARLSGAARRGCSRTAVYLKLRLEGKLADHAVAFARVHEGRAMVTIVTRLAARLELD